MRKRVIVIGIGLIGLFILSMCMGAFAANPENVSVSAQIGPTLQLAIVPTTVDFGGVPLEAGTIATDSVVATISSNRGWSLDVGADQLLTGGVSAETIPSANFTFGASSANPAVTYEAPAGTQFVLAPGDVTVCSGTRAGNIDTTVSYSLDIPWAQAPDTYTATHTYTATQP